MLQASSHWKELYYLWLLLSSAGNPIDIISVIMQMFITSNMWIFFCERNQNDPEFTEIVSSKDLE